MTYLLLKWGTVKGWDLTGDETAEAAAQKYLDTPHSPGAMTQVDDDNQKQLICALIDAVAAGGGTITNDWSGEEYTAEAAKQYVLTYDHPLAKPTPPPAIGEAG